MKPRRGARLTSPILHPVGTVTWAIQTNMGKAADIEGLQAACRLEGCKVEPFKSIPFSRELPELKLENPVIFYGATGLVTLLADADVAWRPAVFFDAQRFSFQETLQQWGDRMLNAEAKVTTLAELAEHQGDPGAQFFIRPTGDDKSFAGQVMSLANIRRWASKLRHSATELSPEAPIVAAEPVGLAHEWRLFVVDSLVVAASHYRRYHQLQVTRGAPDEVLDFAQSLARRWSPARVFVMDVARSGQGLYVVEANCFNSCGFYAADQSEIVRAVSRVAREMF